MFTGIIEEMGRVRRITPGSRSARIEIDARVALEGTRLGDSVAVNGACLTVTRIAGRAFVADATGETLNRTALGELAPGSPVNLERALRFGDRLGGHLVSGHVDGVATVRSVERDGIALDIRLDCPPGLLPLIAEKGSVTIDGVSLTVSALAPGGFRVAVIPHTAAATTLESRKTGDRVNLECDQVARYLARLAGFGLVPPPGDGPLRDGARTGHGVRGAEKAKRPDVGLSADRLASLGFNSLQEDENGARFDRGRDPRYRGRQDDRRGGRRG